MIQLEDDFSFCQMSFKSYLSSEKIQLSQTRLSFLSPGILLPFLEVKLSGSCQDSITHFPNPDISNKGSDFVTIIVMVSPGTHLVQNHESHSRNIESQYKTKWVLGSFVTTQLIWSQTPKLCTTVYWNKINFFYCKAQKRVKEISIVYKQPQKFTQTGYFYKNIFWSTDHSLHPRDAYHKILCILGILMHQGCRTQR